MVIEWLAVLQENIHMNIEADVRESLDHLSEHGEDTAKFRFLGSGISRMAWLHRESGYVVKIGGKDSNETELANIERLYDEPSLKGKVNIPVAIHLFDIDEYDSVILEEYVEGEKTKCASYYSYPCNCGHSPCHIDVQDELRWLTEIGDLHYENVLVKNNEYWIVDLGDD